MKTLEYLNHLIKNPLFTMVFGALLGIFSTLAIQTLNKLSEKKNLITSIKTELESNYLAIKKVQDVKQINNLGSDDPMIRNLRRENPNYSEYTDEEVFLDFYKNRPVDVVISINV